MSTRTQSRPELRAEPSTAKSGPPHAEVPFPVEYPAPYKERRQACGVALYTNMGIARHDMENEEAQALVERRLQRMGVIAALERAGFEPGDDVEIGGVVFELDPG